jgi:hypothetical protein
MALTRRAVLGAQGVLLVGCATTRPAPGGADLSPTSPTLAPSTGGSASTAEGRSPTPTSLPPQTLGPVTIPLPAGVDSLHVTFAGGGKTVYQKSINDPASVRRPVSQRGLLRAQRQRLRGRRQPARCSKADWGKIKAF